MSTPRTVIDTVRAWLESPECVWHTTLDFESTSGAPRWPMKRPSPLLAVEPTVTPEHVIEVKDPGRASPHSELMTHKPTLESRAVLETTLSARRGC